MRTSILLYGSGLLLLFVSNLFLSSDSPLYRERQRTAFQSELLRAVGAVQTAGTEDRTDSLDLGYFNQVRVYPGIRLYHVAGLGRTVRLSGPREMGSALRSEVHGSKLILDFGRPIRTDRYLRVEMDLTAHGSDAMEVQLTVPHPGRTSYPPHFVTDDPLEIPQLTLRGVRGEEPLRIQTERLVVGATTDLNLLTGTTGLFLQDDPKDERPIPPGLKVTRGR